MALARAPRARCDGGTGEDGFSLVEVLVAMGLLWLVMVTMAYSATISLVDVGHSRQRQAATGLANQAIEEVRALPFAQLLQGLSNADLATNSDPAITYDATPPTYFYKGEEIPRSTPATTEARPPLIPHQRSVTVGVTSYTVAAYPTFTSGGNAVRLTVAVTWLRSLRGGGTGRVETQTVLSPGTGCGGSTATHPYAAPCPASFTAKAALDPGTVTIEPGSVVAGSTFERATLDLANLQSILQSEQVTAVQGTSRTPGGTLKESGTDAVTIGSTNATANVTTDPSAGTGTYQSMAAPVPAYSSAYLANPVLANSVWIESTGGDTGSAISTTSDDGGSSPCPNPVAADLADHEPCGSIANNPLSTKAAYVRLPIGSDALLASVAAPTGGLAGYTHRTVASAGSTCALEGCVEASARRNMGRVVLGGLPPDAGVGGWGAADGLIELTGFHDSVTAAAGEGAGVPACASQGTISYWNGTGYTTVDVAGEPAMLPESVEFHDDLGGYHFDIVAGLTIHQPSVASTTDPTTSSRVLTATATAPSPLTGTVSYKVTSLTDGSVVADLTLSIDLGSLVADTTYTRTDGA